MYFFFLSFFFYSNNKKIGLIPLLSVLLQAFCSSLGGVYFQWLLQKEDAAAATKQVSLVEKNIFLYSWGVFFNLAYILVAQSNQLSMESLFLSYRNDLWTIAIFGAVGGIYFILF